jgi:hypothetical protein
MATSKQARKIMKRELAKSLRETTKKTKQRRQPSQEHQMFDLLDQTFSDK